MKEKIVQTAGRDWLGDFAPEFAHFNDDVLFGENWNNEDLTLKTRSLLTVVALMAQGITDSSLKFHLIKERLIIKEHIQEEHIWPIVKSIFGERWKLRWEDLPTDRAFQMRLNRALKKLTEVCNRRLDFDFLLECGDLNVKAKNK